MGEAASTFAGVIVLDQLAYNPQALSFLEVDSQSELRHALLQLADELPLVSFESEFEDDAPARLPQTSRFARLYTGAEIRRRSTVCVAARVDRLIEELQAESATLLQQATYSQRA